MVEVEGAKTLPGVRPMIYLAAKIVSEYQGARRVPDLFSGKVYVDERVDATMGPGTAAKKP